MTNLYRGKIKVITPGYNSYAVVVVVTYNLIRLKSLASNAFRLRFALAVRIDAKFKRWASLKNPIL